MVKYISVLFILAAFFAGCNKDANVDCESYDYSTCNTVEPLEGILTVVVTMQTDSSEVPFSLYNGKYGEQGSVIYSDTVSDVELKFSLPLNRDYYAIVKYRKGSTIINAVDGAYFKKTSQTICDSVCWKIKGDVIDVRLKD